MLSRQDVDDLYTLLLDRRPESESVYQDERAGRTTLQEAVEFLGSEEFLDKNRFWISLLVSDR